MGNGFYYYYQKDVSSSGMVSKQLGYLTLTIYKNKQDTNQAFGNYHSSTKRISEFPVPEK